MKTYMKEILARLKESKTYFNKQMQDYNTFKLKCRAKVFVEICTFSDLAELINLIKKHKLKSFCIGGGSKVLLPPVFDGVMYKLSGAFCKLSKYKGNIFVGGGVYMTTLCNYCIKNNLACVEWGLGIPCCVGGGVYMNAGCFGKCFGDVVEKVFYTDGSKIYSKKASECNFGYRQSFFQNKSYIILFIVLKTFYDPAVKQKTIEYFNKKKASQPYNYPSVGSIFKSCCLPAPLFIEDVNLKGKKVGGAMVSNKHCNFIVNTKNCTQKQVLKIICKIKKTVWKKDAILLHNEVVLLGGKHGLFR